jgi:hypothetical protein
VGWRFHRRAESVSRTTGEPLTQTAESQRWLPHCSSDLGSVQAKLHRAHDHLELLHSEIDAFLSRKPYELVVETNPKHTEIYAVVKERERVPMAWSILVGEIVHNLRSALDHVVSQVVVRRTGLPPSTRTTRFPIFLSADDYRATRGEKVWLRGVGSGGRAIIKAAQPFETGEGAASPLWHLHELSNWDKRRAIPLVAAARRSAEVEAVTGELWRRGIAFEGPLEHDKVLGTVPLTPGGVPLNEHIAKLKMETKLTFQITIQEPACLGRPQVVDGLNVIGARVAEILEQIDKACF